jgi:hypothetical protein
MKKKRTEFSDRYILNDAGLPVPCPDLLEWGRWFENTGKRVLARTRVDDQTEVSTVFLGLDHNWGDGRPILWETLVFGGPLDGEMYRYETRLQAQRGHDEMVEKCKAATAKPGERRIDLE